VQCPKCGYEMGPFDEDCPRCKRMGPPATPQQPAPQPAPQVATPLGVACPHCHQVLLPEPGTNDLPAFCGACGQAVTEAGPRGRAAPWGVLVFVLAVVLLLYGFLSWQRAAQERASIAQVERSLGATDDVGTGGAGGGANDEPEGAANEEATPRQWVRVASWTGEGIKSTETFTVGDEWAIEWVTRPAQRGDATFGITTHDKNGSPVHSDAGIVGTGHDVSYRHQPGEYYLEINSGQMWQVVVWEKR